MRSRTSSTAKGYGYQHRKLRDAWKARVERGEVSCARCGYPILKGQPWDLGHVDGDKGRYSGPEHARCNRATNRKGRVTRPRRRNSSFKHRNRSQARSCT